MDKEIEMKSSSSSSSSNWLARFQFFQSKSRSSKSPYLEETKGSPEDGGCNESKTALEQRKPGGWKAMPFVLGNETCERLAAIGLLANFMMFLLTQFHMDQVLASNVINIWSGLTSFSPLLGAYISDAHWGRFKTIAYASIASFMGMCTLTLITWVPQLHPPHCTEPLSHHCTGPTKSQLGILALALGFLSLGSAGIRPCSIPFGVDQFDSSTEEGRKGINSFFNWYYTTFTMVLVIALTLVVYIQESISWVLGYGIPTLLMVVAIVLFFVGTRVYVYVKPEGSVFSGIAEVIVASFKKRKVEIIGNGDQLIEGVYYDPPLSKGTVAKKLPLTNQLRFFNKAALISDGELLPDGTNPNRWKLCSIQKVEETKCLFKIIPIWASGIICFTAMAQQGTFTMSQALKMNRHLGPKFKIPAGSLSVISMITIGIWLPIYDRLIVPSLRKVTKIEGGITQLQRMGIGIVFSILSMIVAGLIEPMRRASANEHGNPNGIAPMTVLWLAPQLMLMGFAEAFNIIGQIEFYNKEFPENMSSLANSLFSCTMAGANYISALLVNVVHETTGKKGRPDWLTKDINQGRVENFYFLIAGLGLVNLGYFLWVARGYKYKTTTNYPVDDDDQSGGDNKGFDVEMNDGVKA